MRKLLIFSGVFLLLGCSAFAQNVDLEALSGVQFNFGNPGARSLAMGGAFLGLADDASAAEANPAGLTILRKPEVSVEGRNFRTSRNFVTGGTLLSTTDPIQNQEFHSYSRRAELGFASISYPMPDKHFALAAYYSHPVAFTSVVVPEKQINFFLGPNGGPVIPSQCAPQGSITCQPFRLFPFGSAVDLDLKTLGLAGAVKIGKFSLGGAARYHKLNETAVTARTDLNGNPLALFAQTADDSDITFSAGVKWELSSKFSAGAVYKQGAKFKTTYGFANFTASDTSFKVQANPTFHIPDIAGVGISIRPIPALVINADVDSVKYSNLVDNFFSSIDDIKTNPTFKAEDVIETRVGAEYFFTTAVPFALRAGYYRDPAHQFFYNGPVTTPNRIADSIIYQKGKDQNHYSVGVGIAFPVFQLDAAYDTSDAFKVGSLSAVFKF